MTILQEIHAWSKGLPAWQQDAIARIYANRELSTADIEDLYALAKAEAGIEDPQKRAAYDRHGHAGVDPNMGGGGFGGGGGNFSDIFGDVFGDIFGGGGGRGGPRGDAPRGGPADPLRTSYGRIR